jgi:hypothetical protein
VLNIATLAEMVDVVKILREQGIANAGINLDTKCLIQEFGENIHVGELLVIYCLAEMITSIQVSFGFLIRNASHRTDDQRQLQAFARTHNLPVSLEEFDLLDSQLATFVKAWKLSE